LGSFTSSDFENFETGTFMSSRFSELRQLLKSDVSFIESFARLIRNGTICSVESIYFATAKFSVVEGSSTSSYQPGIRFDAPLVGSVGQSFRLADPPRVAVPNVLDRTTFKDTLDSTLGYSDARNRIVDEMFGCLKAGLPLASFGLLGLLSETVWLLEAGRLSPHSSAVNNAIGGAVTNISSVQTTVSADLAASPKSFVRSELTRVANHADFLRRIRNYALHGPNGSVVLDTELEISTLALAIACAPVHFEALHAIVSKRIVEHGGTL
jgi:hypothetical protein